MTIGGGQHRRNNVRLDRLRRSIEAGVAALDRGEFTDVEDAELDGYLDGLTAATSKPEYRLAVKKT
jgi:antitoxin ParD1/3/4